jgi:hypothetical protein
MNASFIKINLYWHTIRFLKPVQIFGRIWFRLYRPKTKPGLQKLSIAVTNGPWSCPPSSGGKWIWERGKLTFHALNKISPFKEFSFWHDSSTDYLQLYNRHYFEAMRSSSGEDWGPLLEQWISSNPMGSKPGWEPYPTSLRVVNLISYHLNTGNLSATLISSIAEQIRYLQKKFEHHLQGNHLFVNGKTSIFGGCFFEGDEADDWLKSGLSLVNKEINKQVLHDGMNYEMSPMYHAIFLVDLLDLINLSQVFIDRIPKSDVLSWEDTAQKMLRVLHLLTHPDGEIALFGDSALKIVPSTELVTKYAQDLGMTNTQDLGAIVFLEKSRFVRLQNKNSLLLIKAGDLGPDHLLAHAHADSSTFELSYKGERLIVDSGIDRYGTDAERLRQRSSDAHNVITIDEKNSSEVWSGFRVAQRAYAAEIHVGERDNSLYLSCGHKGYERLKDPVQYKREFILFENHLEMIDHIQAAKTHRYTWNLYTTKPRNVQVENQAIEPTSCKVNLSFGIQIDAYHYKVTLRGTSKKINSRIQLL